MILEVGRNEVHTNVIYNHNIHTRSECTMKKKKRKKERKKKRKKRRGEESVKHQGDSTVMGISSRPF